MTDVLWYALI